MLRKLLKWFDMLEEAWCRMAHPDVTWPVQGKYRCQTCLREYGVDWEAVPAVGELQAATAPGRSQAGHVGLPRLMPPARA
jgi:hypothetical protein